MNAYQVATNKEFAVAAMQEAISLIAEKMGLTVDALMAQMPTNQDLQIAVAKLILKSAELTAASLK